MIIELNDNVMDAVCDAIGKDGHLIDDIKVIENNEGKNLRDISFKVDGIELNFKEVIDSICNNLNIMAERDAKTLIKNRISGMYNFIEDLEINLNQKVEETDEY